MLFLPRVQIPMILMMQNWNRVLSLLNLSMDFIQLKVFFWLISRTTGPPQEKGKD